MYKIDLLPLALLTEKGEYDITKETITAREAE